MFFARTIKKFFQHNVPAVQRYTFTFRNVTPLGSWLTANTLNSNSLTLFSGNFKKKKAYPEALRRPNGKVIQNSIKQEVKRVPEHLLYLLF